LALAVLTGPGLYNLTMRTTCVDIVERSYYIKFEANRFQHFMETLSQSSRQTDSQRQSSVYNEYEGTHLE